MNDLPVAGYLLRGTYSKPIYMYGRHLNVIFFIFKMYNYDVFVFILGHFRMRIHGQCMFCVTTVYINTSTTIQRLHCFRRVTNFFLPITFSVVYALQQQAANRCICIGFSRVCAIRNYFLVKIDLKQVEGTICDWNWTINTHVTLYFYW